MKCWWPSGPYGGFMRAWDVARKCPSVEPPSFVSKTAEIDSVFETGRRHCLLGSGCSGQAAMTWCAVRRGSPHWQWCGSNDPRRKTGGVLKGERIACKKPYTCGHYWSRVLRDSVHEWGGCRLVRATSIRALALLEPCCVVEPSW